MATSTPVPISKKTQASFIEFYRNTQDMQLEDRSQFRNHLEFIDRTYQREVNNTTAQARAKAANADGDVTRYQDMTVPVVLPQVEAAVTHQASVFLSDGTLFDVVSSPEYINEALQMQTVLENEAIKGGWTRELIMHFRDGFKYNFAPLEVSYGREVSYAIETSAAVGASENQAATKETIWAGNKVERLDPYNTFVDRRVPPSEVYKRGEFAGYTKLRTRIELKALIAELPEVIIGNVIPAFNSSNLGTAAVDSSSQNYFRPNINPDVSNIEGDGTGANWMRWASLSTDKKDIDYKDMYQVTVLYCRILPSEFEMKIPKSNTPQIFKLIIVNHAIIIYAELQTNAHNNIPILIGQPSEDGLDYQTKSLADNGTGFQELATAYMSSIIASKRRAISDRTLYDPSRITAAAINSPNPSAKIPVRPAAYGKQISDAVYAFPYREDQAGNDMGQINAIVGLSNQLVGQNPVSQGNFIKGNKTNQQFDAVMNNSSGRDQLAAVMLQSQVFVPMKEILKINILQFQGGVTLYSPGARQDIDIDPVALRKSILNFKVSDGLNPADQVINAEVFSVALQTLGSAPNIAQGYNLAPLFSYLMKTQGADLTPFEKSPEQVAYEQASAQWSQTAQLLIEKGGDLKELPPQPLPEQYGYNPQTTNPAAKAENNQPTQGQGLV